MTILKFGKKKPAPQDSSIAGFIDGYSIEVMPRTAAKIPDFRAILPARTRVYIAHIDGTPFDEMLATARRLRAEGFTVMPHLPARIIQDRATLDDRLRRYADLGIDQALLLAGGLDRPQGEFADSMQLLETGLLDKHGFTRLHVAGHPEGNRDIDPDGSDRAVMQALEWKAAFAERTGADMAIVTQFVFEADPVIAWTRRLKAENIALPVHIGIAGPAKLQTMIRFAMMCGVGPSVRVLTRRARDVSKLMLPFEPTAILADLARHKAANPDFPIEQIHFFPLGGISRTAGYTAQHLHSGRTAARA